MTTAERNNFNDANDVDRIMEIAQANDNPHELIHLVQDNADAIFTWNYDKGSGPSSTSSTRSRRPVSGMQRPISTGRSKSIPTRRSTSRLSFRWIPQMSRTPPRLSTSGAKRSGVSSACSRRSGG